MNKKINFILVTGGAGFIGRNLCKKLLENKDNKIICIDNFITGNLENIKEFESNKHFEYINHDINKIINFPIIDEIYNLACIASPDKYKIHSIETLNTCFIGIS
jgi:UDP-glucuronate decarboxylase